MLTPSRKKNPYYCKTTCLILSIPSDPTFDLVEREEFDLVARDFDDLVTRDYEDLVTRDYDEILAREFEELVARDDELLSRDFEDLEARDEELEMRDEEMIMARDLEARGGVPANIGTVVKNIFKNLLPWNRHRSREFDELEAREEEIYARDLVDYDFE